jgi:hypothetical protein
MHARFTTWQAEIPFKGYLKGGSFSENMAAEEMYHGKRMVAWEILPPARYRVSHEAGRERKPGAVPGTSFPGKAGFAGSRAG